MQKAAAASIQDYREIGKVHLKECHWSASGYLFLITTAWFLVTGMCATERSYAFCSGLAQFSTIPKQIWSRQRWRRVSTKGWGIEKHEQWASKHKHIVSVFLFLIKTDVLKSVGCQLQETKWLPTPEGDQTSTGERRLSAVFLNVSQIHFDWTTSRRMLKPFPFRTAHRISLFYSTCKKFIKCAQ